MAVKTNICEEFLKLVSRQFISDNKYYRNFNKRTLQVSYPFFKIFASLIKKHTTAAHISETDSITMFIRTCICRNAFCCPLKGKCLEKGIVCSANVHVDGLHEFNTYVGAIERTSKTHWCCHSSFRHAEYITATGS